MNEHPITLHVMDDLRRSRLTVFFRYLLYIPHGIWLELWGIAVILVAVLNWLVALVIGRPAAPFQRFNAAYLRYWTTVYAFLMLVANPFPGFTGEPGSYPVELSVPTTPEKQNRLKTFFRMFLALPTVVVLYVVLVPAMLICYPLLSFSWWASLITGRMPRGFRDLGANAIRYGAQVAGYALLVTGTYPCSSPYVGMALGVPVIDAAPAVAETPPAAAEKPTAPEAPEAPSEA